MIIINILLALLPGVLIGWFIYHKDSNKESKGLLIKLFLGGVASCFFTLAITTLVQGIFPSIVPDTEEPTTNLFLLFFQVLIGIALIEEFSKWFFTYIFGYRHREFDETFDAIVYCSFVALGFATFENVLYVIINDNQLLTALMRAVTAVPGHVCDAIVMGYFLGLAKKCEMNGLPGKGKNIALSIIMPMVTHGIYDFCLFSGSGILVVLWFVFVIALYVYAIKKVNKISKTRERIVAGENYRTCPNCGNYVDGNFCVACGFNLQGAVVPMPQQPILNPVQQQVVTPVAPVAQQAINPVNQPVNPAPVAPAQASAPLENPVSQSMPILKGYCSGCGNLINSDFCPFCGKKQ